ncbi:FtsW/RodA/SpoVE family cell cycle protein [Candidatus Wolfebacteria bacterium]|nr:FtsW/RodA/SpoVE family cell cycle protein [Candidatus Wolfebacteria bacterium]
MSFLSIKKRGHAPDYVIISCTFLLVVFGLVMLSSASSDLGQIRFGDSYFYLKHQVLYGLSLGLFLFWLTSNYIYYKYYQTFSVVGLIITFLFLLLVYTPLGVTLGGATRWIALGPVLFQPSELLKITLVIYLASWLGKSYRQQSFWGGFVPFLIILGLVGLILIFQPATSVAAILILTALIIYFVSGARWSYIFGTFLLGFLAFLLISYMTPYRWDRIKSFIDPSENTQSSSYQINQSLIAIGSGGVGGVGFGKSTTKLHYLPQPIDDSIFAIIAEELGFVGVSILMGLFIVLIIRSFILSGKINDSFGKLVLVGFGSLIAIQVFVHIGAVSGLIPLTGMPLPFISYGGTALAVFMAISGIIVNISKYT